VTNHPDPDPATAHAAPDAPDLPVGSVFRSATRTLTDGECGILTSLTWTTGGIHSDREYARSTEFGELILAGATVVAVAAGLLPGTAIYRSFEPVYGVRVVAALDVHASFMAPVRFGDSICVETTLAGQRPSASRPGCHVLNFEDRVLRQDGMEAVHVTRHILVEELATTR